MFRRDQSGSTTVIFGLTLPILAAGLGGAIEVTRMTAYKQRLTSATELSCHQGAIYVGAERKNNANLTTDYRGKVREMTQTNLTEKKLSNIAVDANVDLLKVSLTTTGDMSFLLGGVLPKSSQTFVVTQECFIAPNIPDPSKLIFSESFEDNHTVNKGSWNVIDTSKTSFNRWTTGGAGLEINGQPSLTNGSLRHGNFFAELDSDCKNASAQNKAACANTTNSSLSRVETLNEGTHEIRYFYTARKDKGGIDYPKYGTKEICSDLTEKKGSARDDFDARAKKEDTVNQAKKDDWTFRIELYVQKDSEASFLVENLMDVCVFSKDWVERKLTFNVPSSGNYRITWRGAGRQDTYGGLLDYIRICEGVCP